MTDQRQALVMALAAGHEGLYLRNARFHRTLDNLADLLPSMIAGLAASCSAQAREQEALIAQARSAEPGESPLLTDPLFSNLAVALNMPRRELLIECSSCHHPWTPHAPDCPVEGCTCSVVPTPRTDDPGASCIACGDPLSEEQRELGFCRYHAGLEESE